MNQDKYLPPVFRYNVPIVWVDTNVVIEMARARVGAAVDDLSQRRGLQLYERIHSLTHAGKMIYLEAEQRREYELNPQYLDECERLQAQLSQGVMTNHSYRVEQYQTQRMMVVYCGKEDQFHLKQDDIFASDPIQEIERTRQSGFIISARFPITQEERDEQRGFRDKIRLEWEQIRQLKIEEEVTYGDQLNFEYQSHISIIRKKLIALLTRMAKGEQPPVEEFLNAISVFEPVFWWEYASGNKGDFKGLLEFLNSEAYRAIPLIDIKCKLYAHVLTSDARISRGDMIDIDHMKTVLPYADAIITDGAMKERLNQIFGSPNRYNTDIFSLREMGNVLRYLEHFEG